MQALCLRLHPLIRKLLPLLKQSLQCTLVFTQLNLCYNNYCPNYYAQLKHERALLLALALLALFLSL